MIPAYMRALVKETADKGLTLKQVKTPGPQSGEVLIDDAGGGEAVDAVEVEVDEELT